MGEGPEHCYHKHFQVTLTATRCRSVVMEDAWQLQAVERRSLMRRKASEALPLVWFEGHCPWFSGAALAPWRLPGSGHQGNPAVSRCQLPFSPEGSQTQFTSFHPRPPLKSWTPVCPPHPYPGCVKSSSSLWAGNEVTWIFPCWLWHQLCRCLYLTWNVGCRGVKIDLGPNVSFSRA